MTDDDYAASTRRMLERLPEAVERAFRAQQGNLHVMTSLGIRPKRKDCPHCGLPQ